MPRPRWATLAPAKQTRILHAAAQAFAAYGFEGASFNKILEAAAVSKGAAYYYFDNKLDLFVTVVAHYAAQVLDGFDLLLAGLTRATFWPAVGAFYQRQVALYSDAPWMLGAVKAARTVPPAQLTASPLAPLIAKITGAVHTLLARGRVLGAVRADMPEALLVALFTAMDAGWDDWLLAQGATLTPTARTQYVDGFVSMLARAFAPPEGGAP